MRPFRHPLDLPSLREFCHPGDPDFIAPFRHPSGDIVAANGYLALRLQRGPTCHDPDIPAARDSARDRIDLLPWGRFTPAVPSLVAPVWRDFDSARIWLFPPGRKPPALWHQRRLNLTESVWTAGAMHLPLPLLQLVSRLPRAEAWIDGNRDFLPIRFSGGIGLIAAPWRHCPDTMIPPHTIHIFSPRSAGLPGGLL